MMEKETNNIVIVKKLRRWLIVIVILLSLNLLMTICLFPTSSDNSEFTSNSTLPPLPSGLRSSNEREKLSKSLFGAYNSRDYHGMWTLMSPAFKIKNPEDSLPIIMARLYVVADSIAEGVYDHYEAASNQDGSTAYQLYYRVRADKGRTGTVKIDVIKYDSESYQCNGFTINVD